MEVDRLSDDLWAVAGEMDLFGAPELKSIVEPERDVILDLSRVTFLDSTGVGLLLASTKRARARGHRFALRTNASEPVMQILDITGVRERLDWVSAGGDDEGAAGVREPRRLYPSGGSAYDAKRAR